MVLSTTDQNYIKHRMDTYDIKYQEIYDEIKDHVILAMETARAGGDERDIEFLYNDMMNTQFPGYYAFEKIAIAYETAYRAKIRKMVWANVRYYLNPLNIVVIVLALVVGYNLPENMTTYIFMLVLLLAASVIPVVYVKIKSAKIRTDNGKLSIVKEHINRAAFFYISYYIVTVGLNLFNRNWDIKSFATGSSNPTVNLVIVAFAVIYGLSVARLCRQEIKIPALNINE